MIRGQEWIVVLLVVLLVFGARKLPELARSLGSSAKEFRKGLEEGSQEDDGEAQASSREDDATGTERPERPPSESS